MDVFIFSWQMRKQGSLFTQRSVCRRSASKPTLCSETQLKGPSHYTTLPRGILAQGARGCEVDHGLNAFCKHRELMIQNCPMRWLHISWRHSGKRVYLYIPEALSKPLKAAVKNLLNSCSNLIHYKNSRVIRVQTRDAMHHHLGKQRRIQ